MKEQLDKENLPKHVAIIMDGNGRWAKKKGAIRIFGHRNAIQAVREATEACAELDIKHLTLYAFSTENWNRPAKEVNALMELLVSTIRKEANTLLKNNIRLTTIGATSQLPINCQKELTEAIEMTSQNTGLNLILALNYSGRWDIEQAIKQITQEVESQKISSKEIDSQLIAKYLATANIPDPELLIRTSGEHRISNFYLWQLAYTEIYITDTLWPDFRKENLYAAFADFQKRERRFGKTSEQIKKQKNKK
ncbi:MAG: isoprenyl transferase [Thermonemataceae bacterium]|nr:isoprenyl transferase [Thermonemataceae bacterium]